MSDPSIGPPLDWSDEDLDDLADVGPADITAAEAAWKRDAPHRMRGLIDATSEDEQDG